MAIQKFLKCFGPTEAQSSPWPKPPGPEGSYTGPATTRHGTPLCLACGSLLYQNNKSHICYRCQRRWGLPTLRRWLQRLQQWHRSNCRDEKCKDPAHLAEVIPARPRRPKRPSRLKLNAPGSSLPGPISHTVFLDPVTSLLLAKRASAKSAKHGCRIAKTDLIRQAVKEFIEHHPDSE